MDEPFTLEQYMPSGEHEYLRSAWASCLQWAICDEGMLAAFNKESGMQWVPVRHPIDRMIDEATGADKRFVRAFVEWFNKQIWGPL